MSDKSALTDIIDPNSPVISSAGYSIAWWFLAALLLLFVAVVAYRYFRLRHHRSLKKLLRQAHAPQDRKAYAGELNRLLRIHFGLPHLHRMHAPNGIKQSDWSITIETLHHLHYGDSVQLHGEQITDMCNRITNWLR